MKILLLTFYYPPDLCAGSFRAHALAEALHDVAGDDLQLEVITTMPNRYSSFRHDVSAVEENNWLRVHRLRIPDHQSGMADQARSFLAFARQARGVIGKQHRDLVVATSSRLMTAVLGAHIAKRTRSKLYLDVRDIFTDTMGDILKASPARGILPGFRVLEKRAVDQAVGVNLVSAGFLPYFKALKPQADFRLFTNGIDDEFLGGSFVAKASYKKPLLIVYAGNIGEGQGMHNIIPAASEALKGRVQFRIIGDGGRKAQLIESVNRRGVDNVEILPPVTRAEVRRHYLDADILFLHLNDLPAFTKVLPSKLFEYAATGKPILAGVGGHAADFLREHVTGAEVFSPCDAASMTGALDRLISMPTHVDRTGFCARFARRTIMREMAADIIGIAKNR